MSSSIPLAYWLMPEELIFPVAILLGVMGLFLRLIGLRRLGGSMLFAAVGLAILPALLGPLLAAILMQVPIWVVIVLLVALGFYLVRLVLTLFLGREGAGTLLAMAVAGSLLKMGALPSIITKWMHGPGSLLRSPIPGRRMLGIALAVMLALLAGFAGRQLGENGMLPWKYPDEPIGAQTALFQSPLETHWIGKGYYREHRQSTDENETGSTIYSRAIEKRF